MSSQEEVDLPALTTSRRVIVVVDLVESVRLMQAFETDVVDRWRRFVSEVRQQLLPSSEGRMVKSLGDGMLLEFASAPAAASAALALHRVMERFNQGKPAEQAMRLRVGANVATVLADELDVYGAGVNLAERLCKLAGAGETVVSADLRADLVHGLDPECVDLGDFDFKHVMGKVRAFRLGPPAPALALPGFDTLWQERPSFAVLPLVVDPQDANAGIVAEVVADQLIHELSVCGVWRVISRLSMVAFRGRSVGFDEIAKHLNPTWVVSGRCRVAGSLVRVSLEVAEVRTASVLWSETIEAPGSDLFHIEQALGRRIVESMLHAIFSFELQRSRTQPLPSLGSHTLLFSAVSLMHRVSEQDFMRGRAFLEQLCERHPRAPDPHAWFAKWHVMRVVQGWAQDPDQAAADARRCANRALEERSDHALGLAMDGLIIGLLHKDLAHSMQRYEAAIAANPNEALAWLFMSALHAYSDRGAEAATAAETALRLSPLDPIRYFYDSFAAHAMLAAGRAEEAIRYAKRSLRAHGSHLPTHRTLAIAHAVSGDMEQAHRSVQRLLELAPGYSVSSFLRRYPASESALGRRSAQALREAGLPVD